MRNVLSGFLCPAYLGEERKILCHIVYAFIFYSPLRALLPVTP
jgi:hypothetical protein